MKKCVVATIATIAAICFSTVVYAQSASSQAGAASSGTASSAAGDQAAQVAAGTAVDATLSKSIDAKKAKPGDRVEARATHDVKSAGRVVVPKGSKLIGRVTQAQARQKGQTESSLGILFERAELKNGQEIAFHALIQGIAAPARTAMAADTETAASSPGYGPEGSAGPGGMARGAGGGVLGTAGGVANTAGGIANSTGAAASGVGGATAQTPLGQTVAGTAAGVNSQAGTTAAGGVMSGLPGVQINTAASGEANGTLLTSGTGNVHLDAGTQLSLRVTAQ